jgi:quercetin dioxygenase-like cupin family protein
MKLFSKAPDGGKDSGVTGYFLVEIKPLFSIVLLKFNKGTREAYHNHAFNAVTFWLKGDVYEHILDGGIKQWIAGDIKYTSRKCFHKIQACDTTWAISIRGPWKNSWKESRLGKLITLTHGRKEI